MSTQLKLKLVRFCFDHTFCSPLLSTVGEIFFSLAGCTCPKTGRIEVTLPCTLELSIKLSLCHQFESDLKFPLSLYLIACFWSLAICLMYCVWVSQRPCLTSSPESRPRPCHALLVYHLGREILPLAPPCGWAFWPPDGLLWSQIPTCISKCLNSYSHAYPPTGSLVFLCCNSISLRYTFGYWQETAL